MQWTKRKVIGAFLLLAGLTIGVSPTGEFGRSPLHLSDFKVAYLGDAKIPVAIALVALGSVLIALRDRQ